MEYFKTVKTSKGVNGFIIKHLDDFWCYDIDFLTSMAPGQDETLDMPGTCIHIVRELYGYDIWITIIKEV